MRCDAVWCGYMAMQLMRRRGLMGASERGCAHGEATRCANEATLAILHCYRKNSFSANIWRVGEVWLHHTDPGDVKLNAPKNLAPTTDVVQSWPSALQLSCITPCAPSTKCIITLFRTASKTAAELNPSRYMIRCTPHDLPPSTLTFIAFKGDDVIKRTHVSSTREQQATASRGR